jgi:hypothetical protein
LTISECEGLKPNVGRPGVDAELLHQNPGGLMDFTGAQWLIPPRAQGFRNSAARADREKDRGE